MPSLTRVEAVARAAAIQVAHYAVDLDLTAAETSPVFASTTTISFTARHVDPELFVDVKAAELLSATLNGGALDVTLLTDGRLGIPAVAGENRLVVTASMAYSGDGEGLHRHVDPADGKTYLYAMSFLDAGPRWFACFDQPDLKARYDVSVRCPAEWIVLGNGAATRTASGPWTLATTQPLATYFVTLVAGPYVSVRSEHDGTPLGLHARASLAEHLDREAPEMLEVTKASFDYYHRLFGIRYPFGEYHQAFVPDFNAGAMENPGCVTFRDQFVFRAATTRGERGTRANTIAHEMAHMWFGDLVTMTWWDDLWLNESFAESMAYRACAEITDYAAWAEFGIDRKDWGYVADQSPSTHPVAGNGSADAESALADFDGISYAKGAAVLKQLANYLGDEVFLDGLRSYFSDHAFGNAEFRDLIAAWERAGGADVAGWADEWLRTAGIDTVTASLTGDLLIVGRQSPDSSDRSHSVTVHAFHADGTVALEESLTLGAEEVHLDAPRGAVLAIADAYDDTWAKLRFGDGGWASLRRVLPTIAEPVTRVAAYNAIRDGVRSAELDPALALDTLLEAAEGERDQHVLVAILSFATVSLAGRYAPVAQRAERLARIAATADTLLRKSVPGSDAQLVAARAFIRSTRAKNRLDSWLTDEALPAGLHLDVELRWSAIERLAELGAIGETDIIDELERDRSASGGVHAARARASLPDPTAKAAAWTLLTQPGEVGAYELYATAGAFFNPEQEAVSAPYVPRFFTELPATAEFRSGWSLARVVLLGYPVTSVSRSTLDLARATIADPAVDPRVRRSLVDATDTMSRALASLERFS